MFITLVINFKMLNKYVFTVAIVLLFIMFSSGTYVEAQDIDRYKIIKKIEIKGNKRISAAAIKSAIITKDGDIYSSEVISKDVDAIWSFGFFDSIEVELEPFENGIKVIFVVFERSVVRDISFVGNNTISDKVLLETISLLENDDLKSYLIKLDEDKILNLYQGKGFMKVKVRTEQRSVTGGVDIVYHIDEGPNVQIAEINFVGNYSIEADKLMKFMRTRPAKFPRFFFKGLFEQAQFELDIENLKSYYSQKGWLDADVNWKIDYSADNADMFLTVIVDEGERYFVDKITVEGQSIFSEKEVLNALQLVEGGPFLLELLGKDIFEIRMLFGGQGFSNVQINEKHFFNPDDTNVNVVYKITENQRVFVEKIKITGNDKTKDNVIRRQLTVHPGEYLNIAEIKESQQRLINTGYFDNESGTPTDITFEPGLEPNTQNVLIDVKEGRSGTLRFGGGFGANVGIFGDVSYTDKNFDIFDFPKDVKDLVAGNAFRGAGHVFNIRLAPGVKRQEATLSVFNPSVYDSVYSAGFSLFKFGREREDYDEKRSGFKINTGRRIHDNISLGMTPSFEVIKIGDLDGLEEEEIQDQEFSEDILIPQDVLDVKGSHSKLGIEFKAAINTRDNPFLPSRGYVAETSLEIAGLDVEIVKFLISGKKFTTLHHSKKRGKQILTATATLGLVDTTSGEDVPIFERFFAGGTGSIRGFRFRGASPLEEGQQIGGNLLMLASVEYDIPVVKNFLRVVTFLDAGKADKDIKDINFDNIRAAAGFGFRVSVPFLGRATIALDWAFPLIQQPDDELQRFSFNVGQGG